MPSDFHIRHYSVHHRILVRTHNDKDPPHFEAVKRLRLEKDMIIRRLSLSEAGKSQVGHIFRDTVPVKDNGVFSVAKIEGLGKVQCFFVDWESLAHDEKEAAVAHMQSKVDAPVHEILAEIESHDGFPIRSELVVFSL